MLKQNIPLVLSKIKESDNVLESRMDTDVFKMLLRKAQFFTEEKLVRLESQTDNARYYKVGNSPQSDGSKGFMVTIKNDSSFSCGCKHSTFNINKANLCAHVVSAIIFSFQELNGHE